MEPMSQETQVALEAALTQNARKAGEHVDWKRTRIHETPTARASNPFRQAADTILRNRAHDSLDRAIDAAEHEQSRKVKRNRELKRHAPKRRESVAMDAAQTLLAKDARAFLSDLAINFDTNKPSSRPWFDTLRGYIEKLPTNATVGDVDPRILRGCIRELL